MKLSRENMADPDDLQAIREQREHRRINAPHSINESRPERNNQESEGVPPSLGTNIKNNTRSEQLTEFEINPTSNEDDIIENEE
jgi:hypothetical protein